MFRNKSSVLLILFSLVFICDVQAQEFLSQLDFDIDGRQKTTSRIDPNDLVRMGIIAPAALAVEPKPVKVNAAARARLNSAVKSGPAIHIIQEDLPVIPPRLKGPWADKKNATLITTRAAWKKNKGGACGEVKSEAQLCQKSKAVKELLHRFTGSDDYYDAQCAGECGDDNYIPALVGFSVEDTHEGAFRLAQNKTQCRYQLGKPKSGKWLAYEATKHHCTCLPKSCAE